VRETLLPVVLPSMGESVTEGTITALRKSPGDTVEIGETIIDVTTDKVDVEIPAPAAGRIKRFLVKDGDTVSVGALLAEIEPAGVSDTSSKPSAAPAPNPTAPAGATSTIVEMPAVGESISNATVGSWLRHEGDLIERDDVIVDVGSGDGKVEIPSPVGGRLLHIFAKEGETIAIGAPLCEIGAESAAAATPVATAPAAGAPAATASPPAKISAPDGKQPTPTVHAPPGVRRLARENGVDLSKISGSGPARRSRTSSIARFALLNGNVVAMTGLICLRATSAMIFGRSS